MPASERRPPHRTPPADEMEDEDFLDQLGGNAHPEHLAQYRRPGGGAGRSGAGIASRRPHQGQGHRPPPPALRTASLSHLHSFLGALGEALPVIRMLAAQPGLPADPFELRQAFSRLYGRQVGLAERLAPLLHIDRNTVEHRPYLRQLSREVGEMMARHQETGHAEILERQLDGLIFEAVKLRGGWNDGELESEAHPPSGSAAVGIQLALLAGAAHIRRAIEALPLTESIEESLSLAMQILFRIARELTFAWREGMSAGERHALFQGVVPHLAEVVAQAWRSAALEALGNQRKALHEGDYEAALTPVREFIAERHMGHEDSIGPVMDHLTQAARRLVDEALHEASPELTGLERQALARAMLGCGVERIKDAWQAAIDEIVEKCRGMTPESLARWEQEEGSQPMPLARFDQALARLGDGESLLQARVDAQRFEALIRRGCALLWGAADAVFKANMKT